MNRFWEKVDISGDCWEWIAGKNWQGYGVFKIDGKNMRSHRFSYSCVFGKIPDGMCVCHHCDNPGCVRPSHLFLGTKMDNTQDAIAKGRIDSRGEKNCKARLTEDDVYEIRRLHAIGVKEALLGKMWQITQSYTGKIINRKRWKHI